MPSNLSPAAFIRRLDLSTLDLFVSICASGSIAAAAARGQLAVSSLSKRIALLEEAAGCVLLERHARGGRPTPAGEALLRHARSLVAGATQLHEDLRAFAQGRLGSVQVAASASAIELYRPEEIARSARAHPDVGIDLTQRTSSEVLQAVREGLVDGLSQPAALLLSHLLLGDDRARSHRESKSGSACSRTCMMDSVPSWQALD